MIVVRREDVLPGGRYAGGRFAPPVPEGEPRPRPAPSPRELRERAYQRIQDQGYLRAQRQADPQAAAALATADAVNLIVERMSQLRPRPHPPGLLDTKAPAALFDSGAAADELEPAAAPATGLGDIETRHPSEPGDAIDIAQKPGGSPSRLDLLRRFLDRIDRTDRGRERRERTAAEFHRREVQAEIALDVERKFARTNKSKVEIELNDMVLADNPASVIREFTRLWRRGALKNPVKPDATVQLNLRKVTDEEAAVIAERTGLDVKGFVHTIDTHALGHAFKRHGPGNEKQHDHVPIDEDSIAMMLEIVFDPANIESVRNKRDGTVSITYRKQVNGHLIFVEQARTNKGELSFVTHYIRKR